jgi:hypothetical protein
MTMLQGRFSTFPETDPNPNAVGYFRDRIALRSRRADVEFPRALDLEAQVLEALHGELHGVASALAGTHSGDHFRERLRGERSFPLGDLCRLATDPTREARAATVAALSILARAVGQSLMPVATQPGCVVESAIAAAGIATDALGEVTRAVADGIVDAAEAGRLRTRAGELRRAAAAFEGAAITAEAKR